MFEFDTGTTEQPFNAYRIDRADNITMSILDSLPEDAPQQVIDAAVIEAVLGYLCTPKRARTVRRHLLSLMPLIAPLAEREPAHFDAIFSEFVERVSSLPD